MQIVLGISKDDITTIRQLAVVANAKCRLYEGEDVSNEACCEQCDEWIKRESLFRRMDTLVENQLIKNLADGSTPDVSNDSYIGLSMKEHECVKKIIDELNQFKKSTEQYPENMECKDTLRPYVRMLAEVISSTSSVVEKDTLRFPCGVVFKNEKLLPYDGNEVKVREYAEYVAVFTQDGKYIVSLYKNRFR